METRTANDWSCLAEWGCRFERERGGREETNLRLASYSKKKTKQKQNGGCSAYKARVCASVRVKWQVTADRSVIKRRGAKKKKRQKRKYSSEAGARAGQTGRKTNGYTDGG